MTPVAAVDTSAPDSGAQHDTGKVEKKPVAKRTNVLRYEGARNPFDSKTEASADAEQVQKKTVIKDDFLKVPKHASRQSSFYWIGSTTCALKDGRNITFQHMVPRRAL